MVVGDRPGGESPASIPVICGPTAAGKSAIALWLAHQVPVTIVSADSRQVYRGFDVGTAKPSLDERARVPHQGVDIVEPTQRYSAASWAEDADGWVVRARSAGRTPLVVGGTGLYLRALFEPFFEEPALDADRRRSLERVLGTFSLAELQRWASMLDPARAHLGRSQLLRVIEIALLSGRRLSELHVERARPARRAGRYLLVDPGPALSSRISARIAAMFAAGWEDEVRALMTRVPPDAPAWKATGYEAVYRLARGTLALDAAQQAIDVETRQYAKRQRTWFRHQLPAEHVTRIDPLSPDWRSVVDRWWKESTAEGALVR